MGFFDRFSPDREGPGVEKNAPPKNVFKVFFGVYTRKFYKLLQLNLVHFACSIPAIIVAMIISANFLSSIFNSREYPVNLWLSLSVFIFAFNLVAVGPLQSGFTYVLRNFSREEHAFVWHDYIQTAKKNFKQSIIMLFINLVVFYSITASFSWYLGQAEKTLLLNIATGMQGIFLIIFIMMQIYTYQLMITFELSIKDIYKNAFLFSIAMFVPNLLIILLCLALSVFLMMQVLIGLILLPTFIISVLGLIVNFYANRIIKKHMIDNPNIDNQNK
ncbi:MAG TPA: hypothetical protein PK566_14625 [Pseudobacteroides sp.]|nr:hypothetical protein [Pseudobacteroides sp.]